MKVLMFIYILGVVYYSYAYNILVVYPFPVKSINLLGEGVVRHLLGAGHQVTYVTSYPMKNVEDNKNLEQVDISENIPLIISDEMNITKIMEGTSIMDDTDSFQEFCLLIATFTLELDNFQKLLHDSTKKYDAVIIDLFDTDLYAGIAAVYDCPLIYFYSLGVQTAVTQLVDGPTNPSYSVDYLSPNLLPLNFVQRIQELWRQMKWFTTKRLFMEPKEEVAYKKIFEPLLLKRGRQLPEYQELIFNVSLILSNEYYSFGNIPSTPQNFKFIAGQHIETPAKPLPSDLQTLMDNSENGVIYFSLGSMWESKEIPMFVTESLLNMFSQLKQTVIWKYEANLKDLPKNVHIIEWAPQHSILAHPKLRLFISHGGLLSSTEAVHFGVPIIGVPIFMDQTLNINKAVAKGYAIKVTLNFNVADGLKEAIGIMLNDDRYQIKAKELSAVYHDRLVPPGQELVHWVEHVIRTRGAPHMRSPALDVPFYKKIYFDLIALIFVVLIVVKTALKRLFVSKKKFSTKKKTN